MADLLVELDPTAEATGTVLTYASLGDLVAHQAPPPPLNALYAGSVDTFGDVPAALKYGNGEIRDTLVVHGTTASDLETKLGSLSKKLGKIQREGGTYKRTSVTGSAVVFDLLPDSDGAVEWDIAHLGGNAATVELRFTRKPAWRGTEQSLGTFTETTLPVLQAVVSGIKGSLLANGRAVITATQGDQWKFFTGVQSHYYDSSAHAALLYEAEGRTPLGGAAIAVGSATPSGAGSNVMRQATLTTTYQAMMSTHALAGTPLQHIGNFQVLARVYRPTSNTGAVSLYLEWGAGDFQTPAKNDPINFAADAYEGQWLLCKLGTVHIPKASQGTQKWEGRIVAKSTVTGDDLDIDWIGFCPTSAEGDPSCYGEWSGLQRFETPSSFTAFSSFDTETGAITGDSLTTGGVWGGAGDADDYSAAASVATRTAVSDAAGTARWAIAGSSALTNVISQVDWKYDVLAGFPSLGPFCRYTDTNNFAVASFFNGNLFLQKRIAGTYSNAARTTNQLPFDVTQYITTRVMVDTSGRFAVWCFPTGTAPGDPILTGQDPVFATGGTLATGTTGIYDLTTGATAVTRTYDNFMAFAPTLDAACFATRTLEIRHDRAERFNAAGTTPNRVSSRRGRYLRFAPGAGEGRSNRFFLKGVRGNEVQDNVWVDSAIDDIAVDLFATPLGVAVPEP